MPVPLDEYPLHQVPLSLAHVASTDRNAYDRSYFNAHNRTDDLFLITGFGVYPNLGVTGAFALVRRGDHQAPFTSPMPSATAASSNAPAPTESRSLNRCEA